MAYYFYTQRFRVNITKYRRIDTVITKESVDRILQYARRNNLELIKITYRGFEIYPRNRILTDGRLGIPRELTLIFDLWGQAPTTITVVAEFQYLEIKKKMVEITVYTNYIPHALHGNGREWEYKILRWVEDMPREQLVMQYQAETLDLFFAVFHWFKPYREDLANAGLGPYFGYTNRRAEISPDEVNRVKEDLAVGIFSTETGRAKYLKEGKIEEIKTVDNAGGDAWVILKDRMGMLTGWDYYPGVNPFEV